MRGGRSARGLFPRKRRDLLIITWRRNKFSYQIILCCSFFVWVRAKRSQMQDMNPDWKRGLWGKKKIKKQTDVDTWQPEVSLCLEKAEQNEMNLAFNCLFMCVNTREGQLWWRVPRNLARSLERKGDPSSCWLTRSVYKLWLTSVHSIKCPPLKIIFFCIVSLTPVGQTALSMLGHVLQCLQRGTNGGLWLHWSCFHENVSSTICGHVQNQNNTSYNQN